MSGGQPKKLLSQTNHGLAATLACFQFVERLDVDGQVASVRCFL